jgi:hypothetical protein
MQPFIIKYAKERPKTKHYGTIAYEYNNEVECSLMTDNSTLIIDSKVFLTECTGSTMTKAEVDPTNDEPTDR